jgi:hypothetical protein
MLKTYVEITLVQILCFCIPEGSSFLLKFKNKYLKENEIKYFQLASSAKEKKKKKPGYYNRVETIRNVSTIFNFLPMLIILIITEMSF